MSVIVDQVFSSRSDGVEALAAPLDRSSAGRMRNAAQQASDTSAAFGRAPAAADWSAFAKALEIAACLADWHNAAYTAEPDGDRHVRAAQLQFEALTAAPDLSAFGQSLVDRLFSVRGTISVAAVNEVLADLATLKMPVGFVAKPVPVQPPHTAKGRPARPDHLSAAFLEFKIDGREADTIHALRPQQLHDLSLTIRVSRWPEGATSLAITPISLEPQRIWDLPRFDFLPPTGPPPYIIERRERMILFASQGINARPLEFIYTAEFQPPNRDRAVLVAGQRALRLDGADPTQDPISGWRDIDAKILAIRNELRLTPLVHEDDLGNLLTLLVPIGALMGDAAFEGRYPQPIDEATFQIEFRRALRSKPSIGSALQDQTNVAGGRVDLSFGNIAIELKSERSVRLAPHDCGRFSKQAASYAVGRGSRLALLCILDCSSKTEVGFPVDDGIFVQTVETGASPVLVVTCLIQGGLAKPSSFSR